MNTVPFTQEEISVKLEKKSQNALSFLAQHGETVRHALNALDTEECKVARKALSTIR